MKNELESLLSEIDDLIYQSTKEKSHYYVGSVLKKISKLLREGHVLTSANKIDWNDEDAINNSYKALLINIIELKPKTREERAIELLRKIVDNADKAKKTLTMDGFIDYYKIKAIELLKEFDSE